MLTSTPYSVDSFDEVSLVITDALIQEAEGLPPNPNVERLEGPHVPYPSCHQFRNPLKTQTDEDSYALQKKNWRSICRPTHSRYVQHDG